MRLTFILCFLIVAYEASSQATDISGKWEGSSDTPYGALPIKLDFIQNGFFVTGTAKHLRPDKNDSSAYTFNGEVKGKKIYLKGLKYLYKSSMLDCLPRMHLEYTVNASGEPKLDGKWKSNMVIGGCLPLVSGKMELTKVRESTPIPIEQPKATRAPVAAVKTDDWIGDALTNKLKISKYYGVIIGIDQYNAEGIQSLDNPVSDATALAKILQEKYHFDQNHLHLLTNPTRSDIIQVFDKLSADVTEQDNILIFYAGHGIWDEKLEQGYWLPTDASLNSKANWLSNSTLRDYIGGIHSKHSLLITDACFSGSILKERAIVYANSKAILEMYKLPSRKAITSGTLKTVPDKSVFFQYLHKNLENNELSFLSAGSLFRNFKIAVVNNSPNGQVPQYGAISQTGDEGGEFIFLLKED